MLYSFHVPHAWTRTLLMIREAGFPDAQIVGGALRDLDNEKPVKDIDVFVSCRGDDYDRLCLALARKGTRLVTPEAAEYLKSMSDVVEVINFGPIDGVGSPDLQVIVTVPGFDFMTRVDFGLCQIGWDGLTIGRSEAYYLDRTEKTFTLTRCASVEEFERSYARFVRLSEKYSDFRLVVPPEFKQFQAWHLPADFSPGEWLPTLDV